MRSLIVASTVILLGPAWGAQHPSDLRHTTKDGRLAPLLENLGNLRVPVTISNTDTEDLKRHRANGWSLKGLELSLRKQQKTGDADLVQQQFQQAWLRADMHLAGSRF